MRWHAQAGLTVGLNGYVLQGLRGRCAAVLRAGFGLRGTLRAGFRLRCAVVGIVCHGKLGKAQTEQGECDFV